MPQIIMVPLQPYQFPPLAPQQYMTPPAPAGRQSSPPGTEDPADLHRYITCFKLCEPLLVGTIKECLIILSQEGQEQVQREGRYMPLTAEVVKAQLQKLE